MPCWKSTTWELQAHSSANVFLGGLRNAKKFEKDDVAVSSKLQGWNRPRRRKLEPVPAQDLDFSRPRRSVDDAASRQSVAIDRDPRPMTMRRNVNDRLPMAMSRLCATPSSTFGIATLRR